MAILWRLLQCFAPLGLTPLIALLIAEGYLNFGGGEKDLVLVIPWLMWSMLYAVIYTILWTKRKRNIVCVYSAAGGAAGLMILIWIGIYIFSASQIGIRK